NPRANFQPHTLQYTPSERSIESNVLDLVRPRSSTLPLVSRNAATNLNFQSSRPSAPAPAAAPFSPDCGDTRAPGAGAGSPGRGGDVRTCSLSALTFCATTSC